MTMKLLVWTGRKRHWPSNDIFLRRYEMWVAHEISHSQWRWSAYIPVINLFTMSATMVSNMSIMNKSELNGIGGAPGW